METFFLHLVFDLELLILLLLLVDFVAKDGVHLLTLEELVDHFSDIGISSGLLDLLKCSLDSSVLGHLLLHLPFKELTPQFLHHERVPLLDLICILAVVLGCLGNSLLPLDAFLALLESLIFVLDRCL